MIDNKTPHSPGRWLSGAGSLGLPAWPFRPWTVDRGRAQGAGSGRSGPDAGSCLASLRLQGVQGEVTGGAERQTAARAAAAQGWQTGAAPQGAFGSPAPPAPPSSRASTGCRLRMSPRKVEERFTANRPRALLDQES